MLRRTVYGIPHQSRRWLPRYRESSREDPDVELAGTPDAAARPRILLMLVGLRGQVPRSSFALPRTSLRSARDFLRLELFRLRSEATREGIRVLSDSFLQGA